MSTPSAFTQFCDDVRRELDGRSSLIGVFPKLAVVDLEGRETLPKICAYSVITIPFGEELESIRVIGTWNERMVQEVKIPETAIADFNQKQATETNKKQSLNLATVLTIRDLVIGKGGLLRTRVLVNDMEINVSTLRLTPR